MHGREIQQSVGSMSSEDLSHLSIIASKRSRRPSSSPTSTHNNPQCNVIQVYDFAKISIPGEVAEEECNPSPSSILEPFYDSSGIWTARRRSSRRLSLEVTRDAPPPTDIHRSASAPLTGSYSHSQLNEDFQADLDTKFSGPCLHSQLRDEAKERWRGVATSEASVFDFAGADSSPVDDGRTKDESPNGKPEAVDWSKLYPQVKTGRRSMDVWIKPDEPEAVPPWGERAPEPSPKQRSPLVRAQTASDSTFRSLEPILISEAVVKSPTGLSDKSVSPLARTQSASLEALNALPKASNRPAPSLSRTNSASPRDLGDAPQTPAPNSVSKFLNKQLNGFSRTKSASTQELNELTQTPVSNTVAKSKPANPLVRAKSLSPQDASCTKPMPAPNPASKSSSKVNPLVRTKSGAQDFNEMQPVPEPNSVAKFLNRQLNGLARAQSATTQEFAEMQPGSSPNSSNSPSKAFKHHGALARTKSASLEALNALQPIYIPNPASRSPPRASNKPHGSLARTQSASLESLNALQLISNPNPKAGSRPALASGNRSTSKFRTNEMKDVKPFQVLPEEKMFQPRAGPLLSPKAFASRFPDYS